MAEKATAQKSQEKAQESVTINFGDKKLDCPVISGTENEKGFDIGQLRSKTGYITLDNGYGSTGTFALPILSL